MSQLYENCHPYWNPHEPRISDSLSKDLSLKVDASSQMCDNVKNLGFQLRAEISSSQSTDSNHGGGNNSQDQSNSSESGQEVSCSRSAEGRLKPVLSMGSQYPTRNPPQVDYGHTVACVPYPYADTYFSGALAAPYQPTNTIQPQILGISPARVPLPMDMSGNVMDDEPIFVNAKQYHGIMRRRQSRAKLESQNKLIKVRKPYLHESRHKHAMNRVRGSGGRFLSVKQLQEQRQQRHSPSCSAAPTTAAAGLGSGHHCNSYLNGSTTTTTTTTLAVSSSSFDFRNLSSHHQLSEFMKSSSGEQHYAHIVR